jgi:hypothetical protein
MELSAPSRYATKLGALPLNPLECASTDTNLDDPCELESTPVRHLPFNEAPLVLRDEVLLTALDELTPTVVAVMVLFAVMNVTIFLKLG